MRIRYRKIEETNTERKEFGGHVWKPHPGQAPHTPEPGYIAELLWVIEGEEETLPIALVVREKMSGCGINMWGSSHRWCIATHVNIENRKRDAAGRVFRTYVDTLADAKIAIEEHVAKLLRAGMTKPAEVKA